MNEQTPAPSPAPAEPQATPSPDDSLKSIANEFTVEEQANQFTAKPAQPQVSQPQDVQLIDFAPDPVTNPEGYKQFMRSQFQAQQQVQSVLRDISTKVSKFEQTWEEQRLNAEVDSAVQIVNQKLKVEPVLAEALLNVEYKQNPTFRRIWDNRDRNPEAYKKALGVLADKLYSKVQVRQDPQLAENVRAAQSSQRTMATTKQSRPEDDVPEDPRDFDRWWMDKMRGM